LAVATVVAVVFSWREGAAASSSIPGSAEPAEAVEHWIVLAKTQNLDFYTCLGLTTGLYKMGPKTRRLMPAAFMLVVMQGVLPCLLVLYHARDFQYYSMVQDMWFRLCGFVLFCFSVLHVYTGASDECRAMFIDLALRYNVSWRFLLPMVVGEVLNAFSAYTLVITLLLVFCHVDNAPELLVHCLAINFIVSIDNDLVDEETRYFSIGKLHEVLQLAGSKEEDGDFKYIALRVTKMICTMLKFVLTLCVGLGFALIFFFAHQEHWCQLLGAYSSWPFCAGLP